MSSIGESSTFSDENALSLLEVMSEEKHDTLILLEDIKISNGNKDIIVKRQAESIGSNVSIQYNFIRKEDYTTNDKNLQHNRQSVDVPIFDGGASRIRKRISENDFFKRLITGLHLHELCSDYEQEKYDFIHQLEEFKTQTKMSMKHENCPFDFQKELAMQLLESTNKMAVFESEHTRKVVLSEVNSKAKLRQLLNLYKSHFKFSYIVEEKLLACIDDFVSKVKQNKTAKNHNMIVVIAEGLAKNFVSMKKSRVHMLQQLDIVNEAVNAKSINERHLYNDLLHKIILDCEETNMKAYKLRVFHNDLKELKDFLLNEMPDFKEETAICQSDFGEPAMIKDLKNIFSDIEGRLDKVEDVVFPKASKKEEISDIIQLTNIIGLLKNHDEVMIRKYAVLNAKMDGLQCKLKKCEDNVVQCFTSARKSMAKKPVVRSFSNDLLSFEYEELEKMMKKREMELKTLHKELSTQYNFDQTSSMEIDVKFNEDTFDSDGLEQKIDIMTRDLKEYDSLMEEIAMLENKVAEQKKLIGPYKDQLQQYKIERCELLMETEKNKTVLENKHLIIADVIGHQNKNQKIKHVHMVIKKHFELKDQNEQLLKKLVDKNKEVEELRERCQFLSNSDLEMLFKTPSPTKRRRFSSTPPVWKLTIPNSPLEKYDSPKQESPCQRYHSPISSTNLDKNTKTPNTPTITEEKEEEIENLKFADNANIEITTTPKKLNIKEVLNSSYNDKASIVKLRI